jgi:hypothetical protein
MVGSEYFPGALADDDAGSHGVAGGDTWHDRPIRDTKSFDSINFKIAINHRHGVSAHLGGTRLNGGRYWLHPDEVLELCTFQAAWHHLTLGERRECGGVAYLAAELHAGYRDFQVGWVRHSIRFNLKGSSGFGPVRRILPRLFGRTMPPNNVQPIAA